MDSSGKKIPKKFFENRGVSVKEVKPMPVKNYRNLKKSTFDLLNKANKKNNWCYAIGKKTVKEDDEVYTLLKFGKEIAAGEEDNIRLALIKEVEK